jgi:hypothetical protein
LAVHEKKNERFEPFVEMKRAPEVQGGIIIITHLLGLAPEGWLASPDIRA